MRNLRSPYMEWAKTNFTTPPECNLASSGLGNVKLAELENVSLDAFEITGISFYGYDPLQQALAKFTGALDPSHIFAATGTSMGNMLSFAATLERGDTVLIEHPIYDLLESALQFLEADIRHFQRRPEDGFRLDVDEIRRNLTPNTKLIVLTNLHNPSSVLTPEAPLRELGALARETGAKVLVDEVYLDSAFELAPRSAYWLGPEFIVTSSLTKVYGLSGLRCGWVTSQDASFIRRLWRLNDLFGVIPAHPAEKLSVLALSQIDRLRARAKSILDGNRALVNEFLAGLGQPPVLYGTVAFPRIDRAEELTRLLIEKYQTAVVPGRFFDLPDHLRIGFGGSREILAEGLKRIRAAIDSGAY